MGMVIYCDQKGKEEASSEQKFRLQEIGTCQPEAVLDDANFKETKNFKLISKLFYYLLPVK